MVAVMVWPEHQRGCVTLDARMRWSYYSALKVLHLLRCPPHGFSRRFRDLRLSLARLYSANNQLKPIRHSVAAGYISFQLKMVALGETCFFARNSRLFGTSAKHTLPPGGHSLWLCLHRWFLLTVILVVLVFIWCHSRYSAS